jgi:hypothetical protein
MVNIELELHKVEKKVRVRRPALAPSFVRNINLHTESTLEPQRNRNEFFNSYQWFTNIFLPLSWQTDVNDSVLLVENTLTTENLLSTASELNNWVTLA